MTSAAPGRRGRRPGSPDTRAAILSAARAAFASGGFAGSTVRGIAADAGVDAALIHHYFGSKADLFVAALELPADPRILLAEAVAGGAEGAAERMLRVFLTVWDDPEMRAPLLAMIRGVFEPSGRTLIRDGFLAVVVLPIGRQLGIDEPERRMPVAASQVIGLIMMRYLLEVEPLASMPADEVVAIYAPTLQRYLTGPLA
ncbi:TetR/AcrR family transcriptional regulator [Nocardioides limicola]|uniref:TetR/AcrR family transcriptional regulator n=1 Tax=Nocardioides limicola TaxID=2803368 RepID=UPI00193BCAEA|nr:TetR family transcriptional regulator [Nocardioides sp. DJM-14]